MENKCSNCGKEKCQETGFHTCKWDKKDKLVLCHGSCQEKKECEKCGGNNPGPLYFACFCLPEAKADDGELPCQSVEGILRCVITRETHKGTHARVVIQTSERLLELFTSHIALAERRGGERVVAALEKKLEEALVTEEEVLNAAHAALDEMGKA